MVQKKIMHKQEREVHRVLVSLNLKFSGNISIDSTLYTNSYSGNHMAATHVGVYAW